MGGAEIADPVPADGAPRPGLLEGAERFRERHARVEVVGQVHLDPVHPEPVQAGPQLAGDPLGGQAVVGPGRHRVAGLRGELRPGAPAGDPAADRGLAAPAAVSVGGVEVGDAGRPGGIHHRQRLVFAQPLAEEHRRGAHPAEVATAQRDPGDRQDGRPRDLGRLAHRPGPPLMIIRDIQPGAGIAGQCRFARRPCSARL